MPAPVAKFSKALGRTLYRGVTRDKNGKQGYGFISKDAFDYQEGVENYLRNQLGKAPSGMSWVQIAAKYHERFADYLGDLE